MNTDTKTKAPPTWMQRKPLTRFVTQAQLEQWSERRLADAQQQADPDVRAGLAESAQTMAAAASFLRERTARQLPTRLIERLETLHTSRLAMATSTTGDSEQRAAYMDQAHTLAEAMRYLKEG